MAPDRHCRLRALKALLAGAAFAVAIAAVAPAATHGHPRCFGAASRDALAPCHNAALRREVFPSPARAAKQGPVYWIGSRAV